MLVRIERARGYGYVAFPVNPRHRNRLRRDMIAGGAGGKFDPGFLDRRSVKAEVYLQEFHNVESAFDGLVPESKLKELDSGYPIVVRVDDWSFQHLLGYCNG